jgi:hypothetical protein
LFWSRGPHCHLIYSWFLTQVEPDGYFLRQMHIKPVALRLGGILKGGASREQGDVGKSRGDPGKETTPEIASSNLCVSVFDILHRDGKNLTHLGLSERIEILEKVCVWKPRVFERVHTSDGTCVEDIYTAMYNLSAREEGVVIKLPTSSYVPGQRYRSGWFKYKPDYIQGGCDTFDCVIIGGKYKYGKIHSFVVGVAENFSSGNATSLVHYIIPVM